MKGIILAGGSGTRLYPSTIAVNKHFLPIYNKPMIYYPFSVLMLAKIKEVLLIANESDIPMYKKLFGDGSELGMKVKYKVQREPRGLAEGLILASEFLNGEPACMILGDNVFFGHSFGRYLEEARAEVENNGGAVVFGYYVKDPERFGVVEFDSDGKVVSIEEKPKSPKSNFALTGLYFFDPNASNIASSVKPSERGELEITSVLEEYLRRNSLSVKLLGRGFAWFDAGTHDSFLEAGEFVATIEKRTGLMIACLEEIAYKNGWIDEKALLKKAELLRKTEYGKYLREIAGG